MDIKEIKRRFEALKKVYGALYCPVALLADELGVRRSDLMFFIMENPKLFEIRKSKMEDVRKEFGVHAVPGVVVWKVFADARFNPEAEEFVDEKRKENERVVFVNGYDSEWYMVMDYLLDEKSRRAMWRNTREKMAEIEKLGILEAGESVADEGGYVRKMIVAKNWLEVLTSYYWKVKVNCIE